jgi:sulfite exporter TauE/SafE
MEHHLMAGPTMYITLLLSGLVASASHCAGMCGPLVLMVGSRIRGGFASRLERLLTYHGARVVVYGLLGALVGGAGGLIGLGTSLTRLAAGVSVVLGASLLLVGLGYLGLLPRLQVDVAGGWIGRTMGRLLDDEGPKGTILLGALNGLLPCGLVYSALLMASSVGSAGAGALGMIAFGTGTLPALLFLGLGGRVLSTWARKVMMRVAGLLFVLVGLQLVFRGLAAFAVIPHLHLGGVVFW